MKKLNICGEFISLKAAMVILFFFLIGEIIGFGLTFYVYFHYIR